MALEDLTGVAKFINALNPSWPVDDDFVDEGDNHVRGIKNVLKNTFPNIDGPVTATDEQLNAAAGPLAAGKVVWVKTITDAGMAHSSLTMQNLNAAAVQFLPRSANSTLLVEASFYGSIGGVAAVFNQGSYQIQDAGNVVDVGFIEHLSTTQVGAGAAAPCVVRAIVSNAALANRAFILRGKTLNAGGAVSAVNMTWSITEIQN